MAFFTSAHAMPHVSPKIRLKPSNDEPSSQTDECTDVASLSQKIQKIDLYCANTNDKAKRPGPSYGQKNCLKKDAMLLGEHD